MSELSIDEWVCGTIIYFSDGTALLDQWNRGTKSECELTARSMHGISYSGEKIVDEIRRVVVSSKEWDNIIENGEV